MLNKLSRRSFLLTSSLAHKAWAVDESNVEMVKTPQNGLQPRAVVDSEGIIHLIYLYGDPAAADIGYVRKGPRDRSFSAPIRVNSQPGSAIALGTVRGAQIAVGKSGRVHVAWNGSSSAKPKGPDNSAPMLYTRLDAKSGRFEAQRSVMTVAGGLDGGGTVVADGAGRVYVAWHGQGQQDGKPQGGEGHRRVWLASSADEGASFRQERAVSPSELGACACCGMAAVADATGNLYLAFRSARQTIHRDLYLLLSRDGGLTFQAVDLHPWQIGACPMSTASMTAQQGRVLVAWESAKQVYFASIGPHTSKVGTPCAAPGEGNNRKHPTIAVNSKGEILLAWTEGTGWKKGGSISCQRYRPDLQPVGVITSSPGLPPWTFATAVPARDRFLLVS